MGGRNQHRAGKGRGMWVGMGWASTGGQSRALDSPLTQSGVRPGLPKRHHPQLGGEKDHCLQAAQSDALPV